MFEFLEDDTIDIFGGIKNKYDVKYDPHLLWDELEKEYKGTGGDREAIGVAITKIAVRCVNDFFRIKKEHVLNQPDIVLYVIEKLYEKMVVKNALLSNFDFIRPTKSKIITYLRNSACNYKSNIVKELLEHEAIAPEDSLDALKDREMEQGGSGDSVESKLAKRNRGIIEKARDIEEEDTKPEKKKKPKSVYPQVSGLIDPLLHDPEKRVIIEERLEEAIEKADLSKARTKKLVEEVMCRRDERKVLLGYDRQNFLMFDSPFEMLININDYEDLDNFYFYEITEDSRIEPRFFPEEDEKNIRKFNMGIEKIQDIANSKTCIIASTLDSYIDLFYLGNIENGNLAKKSSSVMGISSDPLGKIVDALMIQDFKKAYYQRMEEEN